MPETLMNRKEQAQKAFGQVKDFLKANPEIKKALRVFDISYEQYQKALEGGCNFYTDVSTSPPKVGFRSHSTK